MDQLELIASELKGVLEVYLRDELIRCVHEDIFGKQFSIPEPIGSEDALLAFLQEKEKEGSKRFLLSKLARKPLLTEQAKELLIERCVREDTIDEVLKELEGSFLFDDSYLIESKILGKMRKHLGKNRVKMDLWKDKIPEEAFETAFKKIQKEKNLDPVSSAVSFIKKTVKNPEGLNDKKEVQRLKAKLFRRGFDPDVISKALRQFRIDEEDAFFSSDSNPC